MEYCPDCGNKITRMNSKFCSECGFALEVDRESHLAPQPGKQKGDEKAKIEYCLPVRVDYENAVNLGFENAGNVQISSTQLVWRPFYKIFYEVNCVRIDPSKNKHPISDSGFFVVDALQKPLKSRDAPSKFLESVASGLLGRSKEDKEIDIFKKELRQEPVEDSVSTLANEYKVAVLSPQVKQGSAIEQTIAYVVRANTRTETYYETKARGRKRTEDFEGFDDSELKAEKEFVVRPDRDDVRIRSVQLIHVPKWEIEFDSGQYSYARTLAANSGKVIADNITNCSKHLAKDLLGLKKKNIAVCDVCGQALCKDHVSKCPECASWRCETHSVQCAECKARACPEHMALRCAECEAHICDTCLLQCAICNEIHCGRHMTKCSRCAKDVCLSCTRKEGSFIFKKAICRDC